MGLGIAEIAHSVDDMDGGAASLEFIDERAGCLPENEIEST